jgi:hypothetical protein
MVTCLVFLAWYGSAASIEEAAAAADFATQWTKTVRSGRRVGGVLANTTCACALQAASVLPAPVAREMERLALIPLPYRASQVDGWMEGAVAWLTADATRVLRSSNRPPASSLPPSFRST